MNTEFIGEHLLPGKVGQFFIILSFGTALLATISYYFATLKKNEPEGKSWRNIGRISFYINFVSVAAIAATLFYIIYNHYFEYHYAWAHSSKTLPVYYIISCFWEGQEGSFLLWAFWQAVLGIILIVKAKTWENSVLTVISLSQFFLASMLIGVEIFSLKIGSSPFILLRNVIEGPVFSRPDYLSYIQDGNGLNPLLQNYWMVIHPPTLFLGFAAMIVPFAYGIAGVWQKRFQEWVKPALVWSLFAVMILGTGIIMGSFWAYEALNFGGFWAWDPVENASMLPWLTLIAAVHVLIAFKNSGHSYFTALFLVLISFVLVLYASFLTRSGILGETSVHAFTDLGMSGQLLVYLFAFIAISVYLIVKNWKLMPITSKDEATYSREFWLFIGALILCVACIQIIATTSIPVFNKVFSAQLAPPTNVIQHYNKWQVPLAIVIVLISAFSQFLKYKKTDPKKFIISLVVSFVFSVLITAGAVYAANISNNIMYILLTWSAVFAILCNARILGEAVKGKWKLAGSAVAHIGFAMLLVGALIAAATNKIVSENTSNFIPVQGFEKAEKPGENMMLYKDKPVKMGDYTVTFLGDTTTGPNTYYKVNYQKLDVNNKVEEQFYLYPNAQQNPKMGLIASPDTKHYLGYDIYTHVTAAPPKLPKEVADDGHDHSKEEEFDKPVVHEVSVGDTIRYREGSIFIKALNRNAKIENIGLKKDDLAVGMQLEIITPEKKYTAEPVFLVKGASKLDFGKEVHDAGLKLRFTNILPDKDKLELMVYERPAAAESDWIVMKAIKFPYINLFWGGTIIMVIGFLMSIFRRSKELKTA